MNPSPWDKRKSNAVTGMLVACGRVEEFRGEMELQPGEPTEDQSRHVGKLFNEVLLAAAEYQAALLASPHRPKPDTRLN